MLKLKGVSKFYSKKEMITSGFNRVDLELEPGEFVVITGESGSGKSTLLNVVSGLDSYQEGEMYINGSETSHYNESDFENYRRKYISIIFQNFNLINSYTVYQNIELVLLLNGFKSKEIKSKILKILKTVDLVKYKNTKVSKLSGGQKQRVAIARALLKDTPIIVADEPTGNLDLESAKKVFEVLHEVSKNKLVIVVTHNYEQVENYATRKIMMHDGKILEDKKIKKTEVVEDIKLTEYKGMSLFSKIKLGFRNTFNIIPKFLLLFMLNFLIVLSVSSMYTSFQKQENDMNLLGYNNYFRISDSDRIIINKFDRGIITDEDFNKINKMGNVNYILKNDLFVDKEFGIMSNNEDFNSFYGNVKDIKYFKEKLTKGKMPKNSNEIIIETLGNYYINKNDENLINSNYKFSNEIMSSSFADDTLKLTGFYINKNKNFNNNGPYVTFYVSEEILDKLTTVVNIEYSKSRLLINNKIMDVQIIVNNNVPVGSTFIPENMSYLCPNNKCVNYNVNLKIENLYFNKDTNMKVVKLYNANNLAKLTGIKEDFAIDGTTVFINSVDFKNLFGKDNYQGSVFVKDINKIKDTDKLLNNMGFKTLNLKDTLVTEAGAGKQILQIMRVVLVTIFLIVLFFISYFLIQLILKSRNKYYSTIRILGGNKSICKRIMDFELVNVINCCYIVFLILIILVKNNVLSFKFINDLVLYLNIIDYFILYLILVVLSYLVSTKVSRKLFKSSAMNTYREEV